MAGIINSIKAMALGTTESPLFEPTKVGKFELSARYIYAPLTVRMFPSYSSNNLDKARRALINV